MQQRQDAGDPMPSPEEQAASQMTPTRWAFRALQPQKETTTINSLGEYLLPFFFAGMEACWFNGILLGLANLNFLESDSPLLPFWGPPLLLCTVLLLFRRALQTEAETGTTPVAAAEEGEKNTSPMPGLGLLFSVLAVITLFFLWLHVYSPSYLLIDPGWLLALVNDLLALNIHFYQTLIIIAMTVYFCWRGIKIAQLHIEPGAVFREAWLGLLILVLAILLRAGHITTSTNAEDILLVLLIPIYLYLSLSAHALARIAVIRSEHPFGLEGNVVTQERAMLSVMGGVGLGLLVLTLLGAIFFNPTIFITLHSFWQVLATVYDWLAVILAQFIAWLLTPFFGLFNLIAHRGIARIRRPVSPFKNAPQHPLPSTGVSPGVTLFIKILLPLLVLLVLLFLVHMALRRRKRLKIALHRKSGDIHESIWSWQLFWQQFKAFWLAIWRHFFPRNAAEQGEVQAREEIRVPATVRTIREIYRALLKKAATRGHTRRRDETPYEFRQRLHEHEPESEPQLERLTEAYAFTRYGGNIPDESELTGLRDAWNELDRKWEIR